MAQGKLVTLLEERRWAVKTAWYGHGTVSRVEEGCDVQQIVARVGQMVPALHEPYEGKDDSRLRGFRLITLRWRQF